MDAYQNAGEKISVLGPTLVFKGELWAEEDLMLKGRVEGSITHTASLRIGQEGSVKGNIKAKHITVDGTVEGDLHATGSVTIRETAKVTGNVYAPRVSLVEGARFSGTIDMDVAESGVSLPHHESAPGARDEVRPKAASSG